MFERANLHSPFPESKLDKQSSPTRQVCTGHGRGIRCGRLPLPISSSREKARPAPHFVGNGAWGALLGSIDGTFIR
ncbi:MAG: hypothetical protein K8F57_04745, partial [Alphaproteobacteria bacterium]|nr:hypothetical protein [Alphaproteobacteria bacterium]